MTVALPFVLSLSYPFVLCISSPFVLSLSKDSRLSRPSKLARSREAAKVKRNIVFFEPSQLRAQTWIFRFIERAA